MATPDLLEGLRHVTIRDLEVFREACTRGSLRAAGRVFRLQAPHVSKILSRLESHLGVQVVERSPKGVSPTLAGQELLEVVRRIRLPLKDHLAGRVYESEWLEKKRRRSVDFHLKAIRRVAKSCWLELFKRHRRELGRL